MIYADNFLICIAAPLCIALIFIKGSARRFCIFLILGMFVCLISSYVNVFVASQMDMDSSSAAIYIAPIVEEVIKMLPVLFCFLVLEYDEDKIITAAICVGIGFATFENCCYALESGTGDMAFMLARGFAAGMMHVVCSVVVGISFALLRKYESMSFFIIIGILASASTFHAIYNLLTTGGMAAHAVAYTLPALLIAIGYPLYIHFREKRSIA